MQVDKHLYNIEAQQDIQLKTKYISEIPQQSLNEVQKQIVDRVNNFNPDDQQTKEQIHSALKLYIQLMGNKTFSAMSINDESFICSLAFYLSAEKQSDNISRGLLFIEHQYRILDQKAYAQSINLFKALLQIYESVDQQYYEQLTLLMLKMVVQNLELLTVISHKYYFLQCLIQIVNQQKNVQKLVEYFSHIRKLYSCNNALLFHSTDFQIMIDILLRTLTNQNKNEIIQQTLKLYLILSEYPTISKDRYRVEQFHQAIREKLDFINEDMLDQNLKNIMDELLSIQ